MGLHTFEVVCPHCETINRLTADDLAGYAEVGCSRCRGVMGLLRDFVRSPPGVDRQAGSSTDEDLPDDPGPVPG